MKARHARQPAQRTFTIFELDDMGVPHGDGVLDQEIIDDTDPGYTTLACVFQLPDTDEYYRFYYRQYKHGRGRLDAGWDDAYPDGIVPCARVRRVAVVTQQWVGIHQAEATQFDWTGQEALRARNGLLLPLLHDGLPVCHMSVSDEHVPGLIRMLGGSPTGAPPAGMVGVSKAAAALGMSASALSHMRQRGQVPSHQDDAGKYVYDVAQCQAAIAAHANRHDAEQLTLDE